jgi:hypothetical protein
MRAPTTPHPISLLVRTGTRRIVAAILSGGAALAPEIGAGDAAVEPAPIVGCVRD